MALSVKQVIVPLLRAPEGRDTDQPNLGGGGGALVVLDHPLEFSTPIQQKTDAHVVPSLVGRAPGADTVRITLL